MTSIPTASATRPLTKNSSGQQPTATVTPSIYQQALGEDFANLHPRMQLRFGFAADDQVAHIGSGVMHRIERHSRLTAPFLRIGARRNILFPETGTDVPFSVKNYAYRDRFGRETVTWHRTFGFATRDRIFDATMVYNNDRDVIVDYLGTHQQVAADLHCTVDEDGGINFTSGEQRCYQGRFGFRLPNWFTGVARVREWWDDNEDCYRIDVHVTNPLLGTIVRYQGSFQLEIVPISQPEDIPANVTPVRNEARP